MSEPTLDPATAGTVPSAESTAGEAGSALALPPAAPSSPPPDETTPAPAHALAVGAPVEFQTTDPITGQHIRGFGIVRGHQVDVDGTPLTLVAPLPQGVLLVTDDEILPGD